MRNDSYVAIPDRLKCTSFDGDYVALSSQIVTPSNPADLEHSTLKTLSDINLEVDHRIFSDVDILPTQDSTNLITSGGVYNAITSIVTIEDGEILDISHYESSNGYYWYTDKVFNLNEGEQITVTPRHTSITDIAWATDPIALNPVSTGTSTFTSSQDNQRVTVGFKAKEQFTYVITKRKVSDGTTFIPSVSQEGIISWTNDGGKENPESVNIKGPKGDKGDNGTSVKIMPSANDCINIGDGYIDQNGHLLVLSSINPRTFTDAGEIKGPAGKSAYQSYLDTTSDNPKKSEADWSASFELESGVNIKTINKQSIVGSGNLNISTGGDLIQSDWNLSNSSAVDFIKNKPAGLSEFSNDAGYLNGIANSSITDLKLSSNSVTTEKINNGSVTTDKIANSSITELKLSASIASNINNSAQIGSSDGTELISDLSLNDVLRTDVSQLFTSAQLELLKSNSLNKDALVYLYGSGLSIKYVKQHIVNGQNVLTQEDFGDPDSVHDTLFVIEHDFSVGGTSSVPVKIPNECKLLFVGGTFNSANGGYININGAEILPNYSYLIEDNSGNNNGITVYGKPKTGTTYYNKQYKKPVYFDSTLNSWVFADGRDILDSFIKPSVPEFSSENTLRVGYMFYNANDNKLYILTGVSASAYTWRTISTESVS